MLEVSELEDGRFAVRDVGGASLDDLLGVFDTEIEATEWMLSQRLLRASGNTPHILKPGGGQGLS